jgi:hypothetical protein
MDRIAQANIDKFNKLLTAETDPTKRMMMIRLLAEEMVKRATSADPEAKEA